MKDSRDQSLNLLEPKNPDHQVYVLDTFPESVEPNDHVVQIPPWYGNKEDTELQKIGQVFDEVAKYPTTDHTPRRILDAILPERYSAI